LRIVQRRIVLARGTGVDAITRDGCGRAFVV